MNSKNKKVVLWSVIAGASIAFVILGTLLITSVESEKTEKKSSGFERVHNEVNDVIDAAQQQFDDELH